MTTASEIFGLLGVNGAGKTTTFRMIMNLIEPSSGKITFNGKKIDYDITDKIGFLTEERSLLTKLTVKEQAIYFGALKGMSNEKILEDIEYEVFKAFSRKLEPNTKHDYLSKIILFKEFIDEKELLVNQNIISSSNSIIPHKTLVFSRIKKQIYWQIE